MDTTIIHDMIMLFVGMAISLMTTLILWLVPFIINRFKGLTIKIRVMEKNNNQITIKFYFKNKSKQVKYVENINVYYQNAWTKLFQCENQIDDYKCIRIEHQTRYESNFSFDVRGESIKETILSFEGVDSLDFNENFFIWFNGKPYMYQFNANRTNWQQNLKKVRF